MDVLTTISPFVNETFMAEIGLAINESQEPFDTFDSYLDFLFVVNIFKDGIVGSFVITLDVFTIYLFCRFKKLRSKLNCYVLNLCCLDVIAQLIAIVDLIVTEVVNETGYVNEILYCSVLQMYKFTLTTYFTLTFCLALDWFIVSLRPHLLENNSIVRQSVIIAIDLVYFIVYLISLKTNCISGINFVSWQETLLHSIYFVLLISYIILYTFVRRLNLKQSSGQISYLFDVVTIIVFSFLPIMLYHFIFLFTEYHITLFVISLYTMFIPQTLVHMHFLLIIYNLYKNNIDFKNVVIKHFKVLEEDQKLTGNMEVDGTYVHADNFGSVEDTRRLSAF